MPYAFAHPVAAIPLHRLLGRASVPSALAIGSMIPDAWYVVPFLSRADSHSPHSLLLFCLPAGLFAYLAFHLIFKAPLLSLLPAAFAARLRAFTPRGLPRASWSAVLLSLAAGALTHLVWDAFTHEGRLSHAFPALEAQVAQIHGYGIALHQLLQHASTLGGAAALAWWVAGKARAVEPAHGETMPRPVRIACIALLLGIPAAVFLGTLLSAAPQDAWTLGEARSIARAAGVTALSVLGLLATAFCLAWRRGRPLSA